MLKSRMWTDEKPALRSTSARNELSRARKSLRSHLQVANYLLKNSPTDQAITKYGIAILWYIQSANMPQQHYADALIVKSCKVADVCDQNSLIDVFIEGVDESIQNALSN